MNDTLVNRIRQCPSLPSLPAVAMQVLALAQRDEADIAEIARIITKDPALSSKILRTVNSSFYGRPQSIGTLTHALVILGLQSVKTLVLGFSLVSTLKQNRSKGFKHLAYWRRSIYAATAARTLAAKIGLVQQEECFLASLLMDIGMLVLDQVLGEEYGEINERAPRHQDLLAVEQAVLGLTHADAAGVLADQWKLPPLLGEPMRCHHQPQAASDAALARISQVVYLSGFCADVFVSDAAADAIAEVRRCCLEHYHMTTAECDAMLDEICRRTKEVAGLFEISIGAATDYETILKQANEALVDITLRSQQQASALQTQNQQLREAATTDKLTGLSNRSRFDDYLAEQVAAAGADKCLALLVLDLDKFKAVNDRHGHPIGDQVLSAVGELLRSAAREQDLAARYGGEEFALVLPGTSRSTATAIAESIRRALSARPICCGTVHIPMTVSVGVAVLEPGGPLRQATHLLKAADMALYAAKHEGRNCVRVFSLKPVVGGQTASGSAFATKKAHGLVGPWASVG